MDIVERLRSTPANRFKDHEAADEIDALRRQIAAKDVEIAKLNDALSETIAYHKRMMEANEVHLSACKADASRFNALQNMPAQQAQAFFWNYQSRKERARAIDIAMQEGK
jgi:hypothetical protein